MALALNNLKRVDMPLNKETKPNWEDWFIAGDSLLVLSVVISKEINQKLSI